MGVHHSTRQDVYSDLPIAIPKTNRRRAARVLQVAIVTLVGACSATPSEPDTTALRVRQQASCVQYNADGEIVASQAPDDNGACAIGFDLRIWM